jgi:hypothetical protein
MDTIYLLFLFLFLQIFFFYYYYKITCISHITKGYIVLLGTEKLSLKESFVLILFLSSSFFLFFFLSLLVKSLRLYHFHFEIVHYNLNI